MIEQTLNLFLFYFFDLFINILMKLLIGFISSIAHSNSFSLYSFFLNKIRVFLFFGKKLLNIIFFIFDFIMNFFFKNFKDN